MVQSDMVGLPGSDEEDLFRVLCVIWRPGVIEPLSCHVPPSFRSRVSSNQV